MSHMLHYCKDRRCNNGWIDEDLYKNSTPPKWKYCPECVSKGKKNPARKPINPETAEKMRVMREMALTARKEKPNERTNKSPGIHAR